MISINNKENISNSQELAFQSHIEGEKIRILRVMAILGVLLYLVFSIADIWALPSALDDALIIRSTVIIGLCLSFLVTFHPIFIKYYSYIIPIPYLLAALGIELMIFISTPDDYASKVYFSGLILVIMILFSWSHLNILNLIITTLVIISVYISIEISKNDYETNKYLPVLIPNVLFLSSSAVIGLVTQFIRNSYLRENFTLQQSLTKALEDKTEEAEDNAYLANHDPLTELPNRRFVIEKLEKGLEIAKEKNKALIIMFIDLNGFKQINDIYGHAVGDQVLKITARRLELAVRKSDCLSRLGGDEFLIGLLIEKENVAEVEHMAEKFSSLISDPINVDGIRLTVGASIGMSAYPIHGNKISILMDIADKKMYQIKYGQKKSEKQLDNNDVNEPVIIFPGKRKNK